MEDALLAIAVFVLQIFLQIIWAARRPWKYLLSKECRQHLHAEWSGRSRVAFYSYIFGGFALLVLSILVVAYTIYFFAFMPDPTAKEQLKSKVTEIVIEAVREGREGG